MERRVAELEARLDRMALPADGRRRASARRLRALKAERDSWAKTALALSLAGVKTPASEGEPPAT
jgi:hypothetical protein